MLLLFGRYHAVVAFGPWLIEWDENSLCMPRPVGPHPPPLAWTVKEIVGTEDVSWHCNRLAATIVDWNTTMLFVKRRSKRGPFLTLPNMKVVEDINPRSPKIGEWAGNCQDFALTLLHGVATYLDEGSALGKFVLSIGMSAPLTYIPTAVARSVPEVEGVLRETNYIFATHAVLDKFVSDLCETSDFVRACPGDYALLKAFDRAFWLRLSSAIKSYEALSKSSGEAAAVVSSIQSAEVIHWKKLIVEASPLRPEVSCPGEGGPSLFDCPYFDGTSDPDEEWSLFFGRINA